VSTFPHTPSTPSLPHTRVRSEFSEDALKKMDIAEKRALDKPGASLKPVERGALYVFHLHPLPLFSNLPSRFPFPSLKPLPSAPLHPRLLVRPPSLLDLCRLIFNLSAHPTPQRKTKSRRGPRDPPSVSPVPQLALGAPPQRTREMMRTCRSCQPRRRST
jgi:hypothetical protein